MIFLACPRQEQAKWTTLSEEARAELVLGLEAEAKFYEMEAREHFEKALDLDPDFAMAQVKIFSRTSTRDPRSKELRRQLENAELSELTPREAFLVRFVLDMRSDSYKEAWRVLDEYLAQHPRDPYALELSCQRLWESADWSASETCYEDLLDADPNWVGAQNRLGYLAMAQGKFAVAEDRFRNYRYVAPDQANPHDSLGELLVLCGRFDEAETELDEAISIRKDFCASYQNLSTLALYRGNSDEADAVAQRSVDNGCPDGIAQRLRCHIESFDLYREEDWEGLADSWDGACNRSQLVPTWLPHLGALMRGEIELAKTIEESVVDKPGGMLKAESTRYGSPDYSSLVGTRLMAEGDYVAAVERLAAADEHLDYWGLGPGMYKLYNRLVWVETLRRAGRQEEANKLLAKVAEVNPPMADNYRNGRLPLPPPGLDPTP
jgi:tetratricopeptide (TPR) repeat protein